MVASIHRQLPFALAALAIVTAACQSARGFTNVLVVTKESTKSNELTMTFRIGLQTTVSGMRVQTVGEDTIVTRLNKSKARRFILKDLTGYQGRIYLDSVDLVVDGTSVWIDDSRFKAHGPAGSLDFRIRDTSGVDLFDGSDLILRGDRMEPVSSQSASAPRDD